MTYIKQISKEEGKTVTLKGWVSNKREKKLNKAPKGLFLIYNYIYNKTIQIK